MIEKLTLRIAMKYPEAMIVRKYWEFDRKLSILSTKSNPIFIEPHWEVKIYNNITDLIIALGESSRKHISDCKLILRPLSRLTEDEKKYMDSKKWICNKADDFWNGFENTAIQLIQIAYAKNRIEVIDYLRSINIDIESPSLFERGIAVYE